MSLPGIMGLLAFLPTTYPVPHWAFSFLFCTVVYRKLISARTGRLEINFNPVLVLPLIFFVAGAVINWLIHSPSVEGGSDTVPYVLLVPATYIVGLNISRTDIKVLAWCIVLEASVGIVEYYYGVSSIFYTTELYHVFNDTNLLYSHRVMGLSENSSQFAAKLFLCYMLFDFAKLRGGLYFVAKIIVFIAIIMTFNRSVLVALVTYKVLLGYRNNLLSGIVPTRVILKFMLVCIPATLIVAYFYDTMAYQFTRGTGALDYSNRVGGASIWAYFWEFIKDNPLWGNGSSRLWYGEYHAHNSYLQVVATHGVVLASSYFFFIAKNINLKNVVYIMPILVHSIAQYGFAWGVSLTDIMLFAFLAFGANRHVKRSPTVTLGINN
jgi:hypothetical protein